MTERDFQQWPWLLREHQVLGVLGYGRATLSKMVECGHLRVVQPAGCGERRYQKVQVALLAGWSIEAGATLFTRERALMGEKGVRAWTGYAGGTLERMVAAGGLRRIRLAGLGGGRFRKLDVGELIGLGRYV